MAKKDFIPKTRDGYLKGHDTLETGVSATTPGCTAADVTLLAADNARTGLWSEAVSIPVAG